jgi:hypothetical protein
LVGHGLFVVFDLLVVVHSSTSGTEPLLVMKESLF